MPPDRNSRVAIKGMLTMARSDCIGHSRYEEGWQDHGHRFAHAKKYAYGNPQRACGPASGGLMSSYEEQVDGRLVGDLRPPAKQ